jgi:site-specific DNA-methyltransferase (adenine-specific)
MSVDTSTNIDLHFGDCMEVMPTLEASSVDSVVTDPPYGISFMGKRWDYALPTVEVWAECLRVLKPGGFLLSFASTRTHHRMAVNIEDAGFELRDTIAWVYGSGFPKSHNVSKAIDKAAGAEREVVGQKVYADGTRGSWRKTSSDKFAQDEWTKNNDDRPKMDTAPATDEAKQWDGWGTALKPAMELITVARKPFKGTVAANVLEHGCGAINVDATRIKTEEKLTGSSAPCLQFSGQNTRPYQENYNSPGTTQNPQGRFPANLIHDGSDEVVELFPVTKSGSFPKKQTSLGTLRSMNAWQGNVSPHKVMDSGSAARFFYVPKANKRDRGEDNAHPTVKPTDLMRYLCRLVTQPGGVVLDPYMGSGSTGKAAMLEGFEFIGIENNREYFDIASKRITEAVK